MSVFGAHEAKFYWVEESTYGRIPINPTMFGIENIDNIEPQVNAKLLKLRGTGSRDLTALKRGIKEIDLKLDYQLPADNPTRFLNTAITLVPFTAEVIYEKGASIISLRHTGSLIDSIAVSCSIDDVIKASASIASQNLFTEPVKITGATYGQDAGVVPWELSYVQKGAAGGTSLVALEKVTDWKFNIENNTKRVAVMRTNQTSLLTSNANSGQKVVNVADGTKFTAGDMVKIQDDNAAEWNTIYSIATNALTMLNNLDNTYTTEANAYTESLISDILKYLQGRHRNFSGELTLTFEDDTELMQVTHDAEFSLKFGLSETANVLFKYCRWDTLNLPTKTEDLVSVKVPWTARQVDLTA